MNQGKCPHCGKAIQSVLMEDIALQAGSTPAYHNGVSYLCPNCQTILGVSIDPVALKNELLEDLARLKGRF